METGRKVSPGVLVALVLLVAVVVVFIFSFVVASQRPQADPLSADPDDIEGQVAALLANADPQRGEALTVEHQCVNCHIYAAGLAAPGWNALADRVVDREPPLSAAAYLYESIVKPMEFLVEGYPPSMPQNFGEVLTDQEKGDIVAYLLTLHATS